MTSSRRARNGVGLKGRPKGASASNAYRPPSGSGDQYGVVGRVPAGTRTLVSQRYTAPAFASPGLHAPTPSKPDNVTARTCTSPSPRFATIACALTA